MKKIALMVAILAITLFVVVSPVNAEGLKKVISSEVAYGCVHKDYYKNLGSILFSGDQTAFVQGFMNASQSGECIILKKGTPVFVTDTAIWAGLSRIRPEGSMDEYWTDIGNSIAQ